MLIWTDSDEFEAGLREDIALEAQVARIHLVMCVTGHEVPETEVSELSNGDLICEQCATNTYGESL